MPEPEGEHERGEDGMVSREQDGKDHRITDLTHAHTYEQSIHVPTNIMALHGVEQVRKERQRSQGQNKREPLNHH